MGNKLKFFPKLDVMSMNGVMARKLTHNMGRDNIARRAHDPAGEGVVDL